MCSPTFNGVHRSHPAEISPTLFLGGAWVLVPASRQERTSTPLEGVGCGCRVLATNLPHDWRRLYSQKPLLPPNPFPRGAGNTAAALRSRPRHTSTSASLRRYTLVCSGAHSRFPATPSPHLVRRRRWRPAVTTTTTTTTSEAPHCTAPAPAPTSLRPRRWPPINTSATHQTFWAVGVSGGALRSRAFCVTRSVS